MTALHATGGLVVVGVVSLLVVASAIAAALDRGHAWADRLAVVLLLVVAAQGVVGVIAWLTGGRPGEGLHVLYGVAMLGALPLAWNFAADAPPRARTGTVGVAAVICIFLAWRLFATG